MSPGVPRAWLRTLFSRGAAAPRPDPAARLRNPHFASFMAQGNRPRRRRRGGPRALLAPAGALLRRALRLAALGGSVWFVYESARALSMF